MESTNKMTITVLATSDLHGHLFPTDYRTRDERVMGLGKLASLIREERLIHPDLLIDNGDLIQGSPLASYAVKSRTDIHPLIGALNELGYDATVPGNHEFNYGMETLEKRCRIPGFLGCQPESGCRITRSPPLESHI